MKCIKKMNDFVLGILMILLSAFLVFGKITETEVKTGQGGFLVRDRKSTRLNSSHRT